MGFKYQACETGCSQHRGTTASNEHHAPKKTPNPQSYRWTRASHSSLVFTFKDHDLSWSAPPGCSFSMAVISQHMRLLHKHQTDDHRYLDKTWESRYLNSTKFLSTHKKVLPHRAGMSTDRNLNIQPQKSNTFTGKAQLQSYLNHSH